MSSAVAPPWAPGDLVHVASVEWAVDAVGQVEYVQAGGGTPPQWLVQVSVLDFAMPFGGHGAVELEVRVAASGQGAADCAGMVLTRLEGPPRWRWWM